MKMLNLGDRRRNPDGTNALTGRLLRNALSASAHAARSMLFLLRDDLSLATSVVPRERRHSLVLRTDGIGDVVLWLDAAKELRRVKALRGRLVLLVGAPADELLRGTELFDEIWAFERRRMLTDRAYRRDLLRKVRSAGFAAVLNPVSSRDPRVDDALVKAAAAPVSIGIAGDHAISRGWEQRITNRWYSVLHPAPAGPRMELRRAEMLMRRLDAGYRPAPPVLQHRYPLPAAVPRAPYYVIFPGAGWSGKSWPRASFEALAQRIHAATGLIGIVCGGADEKTLTASIATAAGPDRLVDMGGRTSLAEFAGLLQHAAFLVSNDTSAAHIAAALGVPSVVILGGGHPGRFLPYDTDCPRPTDPIPISAHLPCFDCAWRCVFPRERNAPYKCISAVDEAEVWKAVLPFAIRAREAAA